MIFRMSITPITASPTSDSWMYSLILQPVMEGFARISMFFSGTEITLLGSRPLSCKDRFVHLLTGLALAIPLIATITWFFMQTFGNPMSFTEPYSSWCIASTATVI
jgi:hypothetical protein